MNGYERIRAQAKALGTPIPALLALARQNDPFFAGAPAQSEKAEWFKALWDQFGYTTGVHLRRVHYQHFSQKDPRRHDGKPYENTESCWNYLCDAGKAARYLGLIAPDAFEDHRNPAPQITVEYSHAYEEPAWTADAPWWELPSIHADLAGDISLEIPGPQVTGYGYSQEDQPYHLELWVEKSTMDDVLLPICQRYGANLVTSLGFQSITSVKDLLLRISEADKPARIFYISDFDPAGDGMPVAVARQAEYWLDRYAPGADIKLTPLTMTLEQVQRYRLPRKPVKDTDRRKLGFEELYGEGQVELDALEALHPGELARIVRQAIQPYRDENLRQRLAEAEAEAAVSAAFAWEDALAPYRASLRDIDRRARMILERYQVHLEGLRQAMQVEMEPLQAELDDVRQAILDEQDSLEIELPERPEPENTIASETGWLYDSGRDYMEQLAVYKARKVASGESEAA